MMSKRFTDQQLWQLRNEVPFPAVASQAPLAAQAP